MRLHRAFTLMELLVVLLIIGILSTVALRTIDATRDRGLFDQTAKELNVLVQAMTGNPNITQDGRRIDFGFYGDLGRLPNDLRELMTNTTGDSNWHGPYIRQGLSGDSLGYLNDAWGDVYTYSQGSGTIASLGGGKYPMTVRVADDIRHLSENRVSGTVTDRGNEAPVAIPCSIALYPSSDSGWAQVPIDASGYYIIPRVPIGTHRLVVRLGSPPTDSVVRWVTVSPRSSPIVDFRFGRSFGNRLVLAGPVDYLPAVQGFRFSVLNQGPSDDTVRSFRFVSISETTYLQTLLIDGVFDTTYLTGSRKTQGDDVFFNNTPLVVGPYPTGLAQFELREFKLDSAGTLPDTSLPGIEFRILFDDGSEITVTP